MKISTLIKSNCCWCCGEHTTYKTLCDVKISSCYLCSCHSVEFLQVIVCRYMCNHFPDNLRYIRFEIDKDNGYIIGKCMFKFNSEKYEIDVGKDIDNFELIDKVSNKVFNISNL